jgi:hypothetical protein
MAPVATGNQVLARAQAVGGAAISGPGTESRPFGNIYMVLKVIISMHERCPGGMFFLLVRMKEI